MFDKLTSSIVECIGKLKWKTCRVLTKEEKETIYKMLEKDYYIILTRHNGNFSSYAISAAHLWLTKFKKMGYYAHTLMNLEDSVESSDDFRLIEAVGVGVKYSTFDEVFDSQCSSIALLKPKSLLIQDWTAIMDKARTYLGRPYDTLYDLAHDNKLSCVELVRDALRAETDYEKEFAHFEAMIKNATNLDPQMFYECPDFEIVYEVRH